MSDSDNRRTHPRLEIVFKVEYASREEFLADYASNVSGGGVFIATDRSFSIGESIEFNISFPGLLEPISCRGEVRWRRPPEETTRDGLVGIGVAFIFETPEQSRAMLDLIARLGGEAEEKPPPDDQSALTGAFRVLLAEDNKVVREMFRTALRRFHGVRHAGRRDLEVVETENGKDAWDRLQTEPFDLAIVDCYMPILDGLQVVRNLRADTSTNSLPVILVSAGGEEVRKSAYEAGADMFLDKPVMLAQLFQSLHRLLGLEPSTKS